MASFSTRLKVDLDRLIEQAAHLQWAMAISAYGSEAGPEELKKAGINQEAIAKAIKEAPTFSVDYQKWYSESSAMIKQLLPDRLSDFKSYYEPPKNRKEYTFLNYTISDFIIGLEVSRASTGATVVSKKDAFAKFTAQFTILNACSVRFESSLFELRQLVQYDVFDSELSSAHALLKQGFLRAAGVIAGVVLEKHLRQVCDSNSIRIDKKNPTLGDLGDALKTSGIIDLPAWRNLSMLADLRNLCAHHRATEPTEIQVVDLIAGTERATKIIL